LSDDSVAEQLKSATTAEELRALLMGEKQSEQLKLDNEMLTLDIVASDLLNPKLRIPKHSCGSLRHSRTTIQAPLFSPLGLAWDGAGEPTLLE
ncbi:hypothetical protein M2T55_36075, partial [Klebsiella pneumoniae]|nr:hypothetical protein [Klebsiella pneumoniae]